MRTRRVLVEVKDANGHPLPHGASLFDGKGNFVTVVAEKDSVFFPDANQLGRLEVQSSGKTLCYFSISLPEKAEKDNLYETANAICR